MLKGAYLTAFGTEIEKAVGKVVLDDSRLHLDLDAPACAQIVNLTQIEDQCCKLFEFLQEVICRPAEYSSRSILKTLELVKHLLMYGSDYCVEFTMAQLHLQIEYLQEYNSALIKNEKNVFYRMKGGSADNGGPVREVAEELNTLLKSNTRQSLLKLRDMHLLQKTSVENGHQRNVVSAQDGLLVGFGSQNSSSNKMTSGGFGSGLAGKKKGQELVVGAQYSLEDMIAMDRNRPAKYFDDEDKMKRVANETQGMIDLLESSQRKKHINQDPAQMKSSDLLDIGVASNESGPDFGNFDLLNGIDNSAQPNLLDADTSSSTASQKKTSTMDELSNIFTSTSIVPDIPMPNMPPPPPPSNPPPKPPSSHFEDPFAGL